MRTLVATLVFPKGSKEEIIDYFSDVFRGESIHWDGIRVPIGGIKWVHVRLYVTGHSDDLYISYQLLLNRDPFTQMSSVFRLMKL